MANHFKAYFIECLTNMHVGSGDATYGVVDKLIQRDPVTNHATIHASSLKGALREHFERIEDNNWHKNSKKVNDIFGKEVDGTNDSETGNYCFLGADLVSLPVRCNFQQYIMGVNNKQLDDLNRKAKLLTGKDIFNATDEGTKLFSNVDIPSYDVYAEDILIGTITRYQPLLKDSSDSLTTFNTKYASFTDEDFKSINKDLPVIARNQLENGISKNLWYEEVVPHKSVFLTFILGTPEDSDFEERLLSDIIQIGGNASIGYGLCKFHPITIPAPTTQTATS